MSYRKAETLLPPELLEQIQNYVDGEYIYIPRRSEQKREWGSGTNIRAELKSRNQNIYEDYQKGATAHSLCEKYYLSLKSIQRILWKEKHGK